MSVFLALAAGFAGWNVYATWKNVPSDLPARSKTDAASDARGKTAIPVEASISTDVIVSRNLFDPERGAGATRDAEESSRAAQRVRNMILVGTVVIDDNRTAIVQDGANTNAGAAPAEPPVPMRLKIGDTVEGYRLAEIAERKVVFTKNSARIELLLDYFRKVEVAAPRPAPARQIAPPRTVVPGPRVVPNLPRRGRIPTPGNPVPNS